MPASRTKVGAPRPIQGVDIGVGIWALLNISGALCSSAVLSSPSESRSMHGCPDEVRHLELS